MVQMVYICNTHLNPCIMATFRFLLRTTATEGLVPIYGRLRAGRGVYQDAKTGLQTDPRYWNPEKECVINTRKVDYVNEVNTKLRELKNHVEGLLTAHTATFEKDWLSNTIDRYNNPERYETRPATLFEFIRKYTDNAPVSRLVKNNYDVTLELLKTFSQKQKRNIDFNDITLEFYFDFLKFLEEKNYAKNTIGKHIKNVKVFLNAATETGLNTNLQYKSKKFKVLTEEADTIYLTEAELQRIYELDLSDKPHLDRVRDLFIIGAWTGLRFSDWHKVTQKNIDGDFLTLTQEKTKDPVVIPLHPTVKAIIEKYNGTLPPVLSNAKTNLHIKEVAKEADLKTLEEKSITRGGLGITKNVERWELVTTHSARRSFATNLYKAGVPAYDIMQITGHKTEQAFLKYIRVTPRQHAERVRIFWQNRPVMKVVNL